MSEIAYDNNSTESDKAQKPPRVEAQVNKLIARIKADKEHHKSAYDRMRADMFMAFHGRDDSYSAKNYKANFAGRHVKQKTAALYAKNPKAVARRAERLDFEIWDESPESLMMAFQTVQMAQQAMAVAQQTPEMTEMGNVVPAMPVLPPGFEFAQAVIADYQQGMAYRRQVEKVGKTLEILFARALREHEPVDFKTAAKQLVRRACTCGVGYVELGFQREYGPRSGLTEQLADARARLDHLRRLTEEVADGEITEEMAEAAELETSIQILLQEPEIVLREGLTFDFPKATSVIPDKLTRELVGFIGARHLTIEYLFTVEQVQEMFPDADFKSYSYKGYNTDGSLTDGPAQGTIPFDDEEDIDTPKKASDQGLVCVWKHYDKMSGAVYYVADGHPCFLREPAAPDVFVEGFWPVYALTFNAVESETELFPQSDVGLLADQQMEHNRARQGMREHRQAARPRWATSKGIIDEEGKAELKRLEPFGVAELNKDPQTKLQDVLETFPMPGVDPNLYATEQFEQDRLLSVGMQDAGYGGMAKATATESAISANSVQSSDSASIDDMDAFLTKLARAGGQILLREMSPEQVKAIVGPGAVWPEMTLSEIASEIFLEVEAGSSGKPNQAVEIDNFTKLAPILTTLPGINGTELAKEGVRRLDDRLDVNKFILANAPAIVAQNQMQQPATGDPAADPNAQGPQGGNNAPAPPEAESPGSPPAFGSNQV
jgi:hypothetical protein